MTFANRNSRYANVELKLEESKVKNRNWFESFDRKLFIEDPLGRRPEFTWPGDSSNNYSPPEHSKFAKIPSELAVRTGPANKMNTLFVEQHQYGSYTESSECTITGCVFTSSLRSLTCGKFARPPNAATKNLEIENSNFSEFFESKLRWFVLLVEIVFFLSIFSCMNGEWAAILLNGEIEFKAKVSSHDCQPCTRLPNENFLLLPTGDHRL